MVWLALVCLISGCGVDSPSGMRVNPSCCAKLNTPASTHIHICIHLSLDFLHLIIMRKRWIQRIDLMQFTFEGRIC